MRRPTINQVKALTDSLKANRVRLAPLFAELESVAKSAPGSVEHFNAINAYRLADNMPAMEWADFQQRNPLPR